MVLAAIDLAAVGVSLNLNHQLSKIYDSAVEVNRGWAARSEQYTTLGQLAARVNAPGNDVFDSHDPEAEEARLDQALAHYRAASSVAARDIRERVAPEHLEVLGEKLRLGELALDAMVAEARHIFGRIRDGDQMSAAARMATMDRKFAHVNDAFVALRQQVATIQAQQLAQQAADGQRLKQVEWIIALLVGVMVMGVASYGNAMARAMRRADEERQEHLDALESSHARLRSISDGAADAIISFDETGVVVSANRATTTLFGVDAADLCGRSLASCVPLVGRLPFDEWLRNVDPDAHAVHIAADGRSLEGSALRLSLSVGGQRQGDGYLFTAIVHDLTRERNAIAMMAAAKQVADDANRAKSAFLANMSHELRTPLNAIIGYSEILKEDAADRRDDSAVDDLERIRSSGRHLLSLIDDILDLSKVEAGRMALALEDVPLRPLIDDLVATLTPLAQRNGNRLQIEVALDIGSVHADPLRLKQVLLNLAGNAAKFTSNGTVSLRATRVSLRERQLVQFEIADTGIGMSPAELARLFQPFVQADASVTRKYGGTGLGLTISRRLIELLGGELSVTSAPGQGSTFMFTLPACGTVETSPVVRDAPPVVMPRALEPAQASDAGTVLVIDDDLGVRRVLSAMFAEKGLSTHFASTAEHAVQLAKDIKPVAITLDLLMPDMEGWAALTALWADATLAGVPVIVLSMLNEHGVCYTLGATHWLPKPLELAALASTLARVGGQGVPGRALVVDDDDNSRGLLKKRMRALGWECMEAVNGRAALDMLDTAQPGLVLLDLMMPELDGFAFLDRLRRLPQWASVPVIVVTAKDLSPLDLSRLRGDAIQMVADRTQPRRLVLEQVGSMVATHVGLLRRPA